MYVVFAQDSIVYLGDKEENGSVFVESLEELHKLFCSYKEQLAQEPSDDNKVKKGEVSTSIMHIEGADSLNFKDTKELLEETLQELKQVQRCCQ